jgi:hypothetical protein
VGDRQLSLIDNNLEVDRPLGLHPVPFYVSMRLDSRQLPVDDVSESASGDRKRKKKGGGGKPPVVDSQLLFWHVVDLDIGSQPPAQHLRLGGQHSDL